MLPPLTQSQIRSAARKMKSFYTHLERPVTQDEVIQTVSILRRRAESGDLDDAHDKPLITLLSLGANPIEFYEF